MSMKPGVMHLDATATTLGIGRLVLFGTTISPAFTPVYGIDCLKPGLASPAESIVRPVRVMLNAALGPEGLPFLPDIVVPHSEKMKRSNVMLAENRTMV